MVTGLCGWYSFQHFEIDADTDKLIRQQAQWRDDQDRFSQIFPQYSDNTLVVVKGEDVAAVDNAALALQQRLLAQPDIFHSVFALANLDYIQQHRLLYLDPPQLAAVINDMQVLMPTIIPLVEEPDLDSYFTLLAQQLGTASDPRAIAQLLEPLLISGQRTLAGDNRVFDWMSVIDVESSGVYYNLIVVQGRKDNTDAEPNKRIVQSIRQQIAALDLPAGVSVRLTGRAALDYDEIAAANDSVTLAGSVSLGLLALIMVVGVRSFRVIAATYLALLIGLVWTVAYASFFIGAFNTISVVFLVMFIGLGVDFAIHFCLRIQEEAGLTADPFEAMRLATLDSWPTIFLCALSSALGFLAFLPTDYRGLAELGVVSAGGMLMALLASFSVIPLFFRLTGMPPSLTPGLREEVQLAVEEPAHWLEKHHFVLVIASVVIALGTGLLASRLHFDFSTLALKAPGSESMQTLQELQEQEIATDYTLSVLADSPQQAEQLKQQLERRVTVARVEGVEALLPEQQDEKLEQLAVVLEDVELLMEQSEDNPVEPVPDAWPKLKRILTLLAPAYPALQTLLAQEPTLDQASVQAQWEHNLLGGLQQQWIEWQENISVEAMAMEGFPESVQERYISDQGIVLLKVIPREDIAEVAAQKRFIEDVTAVVPNATGRPVVEQGVGKIVVQAFQQAVLYALVAIALVVWLSCRRSLDVVLVFVPLLLATLSTLAVSVLIAQPLNMANIVVIPLIFGLGVDNGIHIVRRFHETDTISQLIYSSTPRAVILSSLTTMGTFGALALSEHQGMFSIGLLLTVAIGFLLLFTLLFLPALLEWAYRGKLK